MWDQQKLSHFNFVWYDVTSFMPYTEETLNENSLMVKQSGTLALNSLTRVFASLTPNAKGIYLIIVKYQMEGVTVTLLVCVFRPCMVENDQKHSEMSKKVLFSS